MATISDLTATQYSGDARADALLDEVVPWNYYPDGRQVLYYTFDASAGSLIDQETVAPVRPFNAAQMLAARQILQYAATVTGITFMETASSTQADIHFGAANLQGPSVAGLTSWGYSYNYDAGGTIARLDIEAIIYLDNVEHAGINTTPQAGGYGYEVLLHEVGHLLGLAHPFDSPYPLPAAQDNTNNTVMSYTDAGSPKSTFQSYDLLALQWIYGGDGLAGRYGFNSSNGPALPPPGPVEITGTSRADTLRSTAANEAFDGKGSVDTLVLQGARIEYTLTRKGSGWQLVDKAAGRDGTDTLKNVERLQFSTDSLALDLDGAAGTAARLLGALLGGAAVAQKDLVGAVLQVVDAGELSREALADLGLAAVLGASHTHAQAAALLYANLFGAAPDAATLGNLVAGLDAGHYTEAALALFAADSDWNAANIGLVGLQQTGLAYVA